MSPKKIGLFVAAACVVAAGLFFYPWSFLQSIHDKQAAIGGLFTVAAITIFIVSLRGIGNKPSSTSRGRN